MTKVKKIFDQKAGKFLSEEQVKVRLADTGASRLTQTSAFDLQSKLYIIMWQQKN